MAAATPIPRLAVALTLLACACAEPAKPAAVADVTAAPIDVASDTSAADTAVPDAAKTVEVTAEVADEPDTPCTLGCQKWQACVPLAACLAVCKTDPCTKTCVADPATTTCESAADCLGLWKDAKPWDSTGTGLAWRTTASDPKIPTEEGEFSVADHWNGRNSFIFLLTQDGFAPAVELWKSNIKAFLKVSPTNVHYTFYAFAGKDAKVAQAQVDKQKTSVFNAVSSMSERDQCQWFRRLHFANAPAQVFGGPLPKLIAAMGGSLASGIDRMQQWRQIGLLQTVGGAPDLKLLTYEPRYWNFEVKREAELAKYKDKELIVPIHAAKDGAGFDLEVQLPPASELADYDTLLMDLGAWCKDHKDQNCAEWDYIASAALCERQLAPPLAQKCTAAVSEVAEVKEALGLCAETTATCKQDADCGTAKCTGYVAPVTAVKGVAAESHACTCAALDGATLNKTANCKGDGSGFEACPCGCTLEFARWITTYHREGRWVSDITPAMVYLQKGGKQRINFNAANIPMADMALRFQKRGSALRAVKIIDLFGGGPFYQDYNKKYVPQTVAIPKETKKVELYAFVTGHGFGTELDNCAEFCNHTHHYTVNGKPYQHDHPVAGAFMGCAEAVDKEGTIPTQFGTWYLGRGGWCPGQDVKPFRVDITKDAVLGADNVFTYKGLFKGADYVPKPNPKPQGGFGASINMRTWLVLYQ